MPVPRSDDPGRNGDMRTGGRLIATGMPHARQVTDKTESKRLWRAGIRSGSKGHPLYMWSQPRNGLPWKPYVYRGSGADAFTGEVVQ